MNFFAQKNKSLEKRKLETDPIKLYNSLTKDKDYIYLRGVQEEVLKEWNKRRNEDCILIKMNTGAGKTLVGLLILYSKMIETKKPVVFLCPDNQLLNQVVTQSKNYSIPTCEIDENNDFPEEFLNSEAILIATINKMFNGKNIFDRDKIKLSAIVIDDAHRCVEKVKDSFTVKISHIHELYNKLLKLFQDDLKKQALGCYEAIMSGSPGYYMKVPFWSWIDKKDKVLQILVEYIEDIDTLLFKWKLIENNLSQYEMYFNTHRIEITPLVSYIKNIVAYDSVDNKYALSATFVNDSSILKDFDFSYNSVLNPITPIDRKDYGQRLILAPKRYFNNLSKDNHIEILNHHLNKNENVVVLVPNTRTAKEWESLGAEIAQKDNIDNTIEKLKTSKGNLIVFVNRYEGIDLSGDSCNVLVIHNHPKFKFIKDEHHEDIHHETSANIIAQTIEQGMGRTVRSGNDYSVIYLMGRHILKFLRQRKNLDFFNSYTKRQLELGLNLMEGQKLDSDNAVEKITEIADYCLNQDNEWKSFYQNFMDGDDVENNLSREKRLQVFNNEKKAIHNFIKGEHSQALKFGHEAINEDASEIERACHYQMLAHFTYLIDKNKSNNYLLKSRTLSSKMPIPFLSNKKWKIENSKEQSVKAYSFIQSFSSINDLLLYVNEIKNYLIFDPKNDSEDFEDALCKLGELLGFESSRPEKKENEGSDVLWGTKDFYLILEAKSEKKSVNKISKSDIEQLYHSMAWFNNKYKFEGKLLGITLQPNARKNEDVTINTKVKVINSEKLEAIIHSVNKLNDYFSKQINISDITEENIRIEFNGLGLNGNQFLNKYLKDIR
ncbi:MAG: DEAD/DEAH box helicase family protein [Bacteroidota bacterium]